jgi:hypothetical protein
MNVKACQKTQEGEVVEVRLCEGYIVSFIHMMPVAGGKIWSVF